MKRYVLILACCLLNLACSSRVKVKYDASVSSSLQTYLESDFDKLASLDIPENASSGEASLMELGGFSARSLGGWLSDRTKYIVGEGFSTESSVAAVASGFSYAPQLYGEVGFHSIAQALGLSLPGEKKFNADSSVQTVMTNIGAAVYLDGKESRVVYSMRVAEDNITVDSPRVGINQIGPGLFQSKTLDSSPIDSVANACLRLSTVFHEGGHTNGNGSNAGFPHAKCSSGSYSGYYACENNLNGPYVIGRVFLTQCYYACAQMGTCTAQELDQISVFIADLASRLSKDAKMSDPTAEKINL